MANVEANSKLYLWGGRILTALPALGLLMSAVMKLMQSPEVVDGFSKFGFAQRLIMPIGIVELACLVLYLVPRTAVLGAILLTAYLGGAVVTHLRINDVFFGPVIFGVLLWGGLYCRDARVRSLIPFNRPSA